MLKKLLLGALLCVLFGLALEANLGGDAKASGEAQRPIDPAGRRLFVLILDSLDVRDAEAMPAFQALAARGLSATVEPCLERITYVCVKEALTGRSAFSLFGVLRNFGTASADPGANLFRDAQAAGRSVALMSAGDLVPFHVDTTVSIQHKDRYRPEETEQALAWAQTHDLTLYHYIWHDSVSHHDEVGTPAYKASLAAMDAIVLQVATGLPDDVDLIITGDHGHSDDGRHVQGQDIPTRLVALSPNIQPGALPDRFPISGVRFLAAASTGLWTDQMDWDPAWTRLLSPGVSPQTRALVEAGAASDARGFPIGLALVGVAMVALAGWAAGPWAALLVALFGVGLGVGFEPWLDVMHFPRGHKRVHEQWWKVPAYFALAGALFGRSFTRMWAGAALSVVLGLLLLYPVPHHYGVLKNTPWLGTALLLSSVLVLGWRSRLPLGKLLLAVLMAELAFYGWFELQDFKVFNLEITDWEASEWLRQAPRLGALFTALLAAGVHAALDRHGPARDRAIAIGLSAVGAAGIIRLPDAVYILPMLSLTAGLFTRAPWRGRLIAISFAWFVPFCYGAARGYGLYGTLGLMAIGLWLLSLRADRPMDEAATRWWQLSAALTVMVAAYAGFAWTFGLSIAGIDYTFMVKWMPGRWHERLWWLIFIGTTLKAMAPALIGAELARGLLGARAEAVIDDVARYAWLRATVVYVFALSWVIVSAEAAGLRLAAIVQDGFYWTLMGLFAVGAFRLGRPRAAAPAA